MTASSAASGFYGDVQSLARLRHDAAAGREGSLEATARQFEALFVQMMFKSMREAGIEGGLFDSNQMQTYYQMFDKQVSLDIARGKGLGLADMLVRQMGGETSRPSGSGEAVARNLPRHDAALPPVPAAKRPAEVDAATVSRAPAFADRDAFIQALRPLVDAVAERLDVPASAVLAQSALETGWGQHVMHDQRGRPAWNLFGIKAGDDWTGKTVTVPTMEVRDGVAVREQARFRAYDSPAEAVADYGRFLAGRARYADALGSGDDVSAFAEALQAAGYATDPDYAAKISRISSDLDRAAPIQDFDALAAEDRQAGVDPAKG